MVTPENIMVGGRKSAILDDEAFSCIKHDIRRKSAILDDEAFSCIKHDIRSHVVTFTPSLWGDTFSSYSMDEQLQDKYTETIEIMKEEARKLLISEMSTKLDKLLVIDAFERLGVAYHFHKEIQVLLELIFKNYSDSQHGDLFGVALEFRLLRQHLYPVSCGVFDQFKDEDNNFDVAISCDAEGLLCLYEAAHVRTHGEEILDEAVPFATSNLKRMLPELKSPLKEKVSRALEQSVHRGVLIVEARHYISTYEKDEKMDELLLKFAKINFNFLQNLYKKELYDLSRWLNEFDIKSKLPYVRDRLVECYIWGLGYHFEPQYAWVRLATAKVLMLVTILDDTYDNYATIEEGLIFTQVVKRWDIREIDILPDYMKIVYKFMWSLYEDLEREALKQRTMYIIPHAKESVQQVCMAYMKELLWFNGRQIPDFDEYFANTEFTSCIRMMFLPCLIGMSSTSLETIDWIASTPDILLASNKTVRQLHNMSSCDRESRDGDMPTAIDCYMKQHNTSREETLVRFMEHSNDGWKALDAERLKVPSWVPNDVVDLFLNFARVGELQYKDFVDGFTYPEKFLAPEVAPVLVDPIVL